MRSYSVAIVLAVALGSAAAVQAPASAAPDARDPGAEQFVQAEGQRLVSILADKSQSAPQRVEAFRAAVDQVADVPRITRFVLGKYARTITPDQMQRFAPVFEDYAQSVYQRHLTEFHADTLTVTGSVVARPGDVVVRTTITGGEAKEPAKVDWRVIGSGSTWKVADVEVSGVWLAVTQQADFVSTIDNHGGSIDALIARLQTLTARRAAPAAGAD